MPVPGSSAAFGPAVPRIPAQYPFAKSSGVEPFEEILIPSMVYSAPARAARFRFGVLQATSSKSAFHLKER
jgi:hypothetical protein